MLRDVRLQWLRPDEIVSERERFSVVYLPIGPLEWHGPHLPIGTDPFQAEFTAMELAKKLGGVVYPVLYLGTERERSKETLQNIGFNGDEWVVGMDFPANNLKSYYYPEDIFAVMIRFTLEQLVAQDYKVIVIVNGHGATNQINQLERIAIEFSQRGPARVLYTFTIDERDVVDGGHATITETAAVMALDPASVDLNKFPPIGIPLHSVDYGIVDGITFSGQPNDGHNIHPHADPRLATSQLGQEQFDAAVVRLTREIQTFLKV